VLQHRLEELGLSTLQERPDHYGLGLVLGNAEVRLDELTAAYLALARHGLYRPLKWRPDADSEPRQTGQATAAWLILDALDDADARAGSFMRASDLEPDFPMAAKTGTSVGFRDNWAFGITAKYTIGVWVGNFDGEPMRNLSGVMGAGPILRRMADFLHEDNDPLLAAPEVTDSARVCVLSGMRQGPDCPGGRVEHYLGGTTPGETCTWHRRIEVDMTGALATGCPGAMERMAIAWPGVFAEWAQARGRVGWPEQDHSCGASSSELPAPETGPPGISWPADGTVFYLDPRDPPEHQALSLRANLPHGSTGVRWWVDDQFLAEVQAPYTLRWIPTLGEHRLRLEREGQTIDEIRVWIGGE
jgi:penicillin-binding protein 1C